MVFLHGGPGAGATAADRRFFDPDFFRAVLFDQRGCGRSTPLGELRENTAAHLVADIEQLRAHLGIDRWHVFGGSWGSTLALLYAETHPGRCLSLTLRGIFLLRRDEVDWWLYGMGRFFPEAWREFAGQIPPDERGDLLEAYWRRLTSDDPEVCRGAALAWSVYEGSCCTLMPGSPTFAMGFGQESIALGLARLEAHYFRNQRFEPEDRLLRDVGRLDGIPGTIVQGRYDVVCPPGTAHELHLAWPGARYVIVPDAGHSAREPGIARALVSAIERLKEHAA
jgi:proline iminopeptidase